MLNGLPWVFHRLEARNKDQIVIAEWLESSHWTFILKNYLYMCREALLQTYNEDTLL